MGQAVRWFALGFGAVFGTGAAIAVNATVGDLLYLHKGPKVEITKAQAAQFGQLAIDVGAWGGEKQNMISVCARLEPDGKFSADATGLKAEPKEQLPFPVRVVGVVE
jgi:hypothetical protein